MVNEIEIKKVNSSDTKYLQKFIEKAGNSTISFRYFDTRPLSIISNHLLTVVSLINEIPVGYGHLDTEDDNIWLGIAVGENYKGRGIGKIIMNYLIEYIDNSNVSEVFLSVDLANTIALNMYKKYGFVVVKELPSKAYIMKRKKI